MTAITNEPHRLPSRWSRSTRRIPSSTCFSGTSMPSSDARRKPRPATAKPPKSRSATRIARGASASSPPLPAQHSAFTHPQAPLLERTCGSLALSPAWCAAALVMTAVARRAVPRGNPLALGLAYLGKSEPYNRLCLLSFTSGGPADSPTIACPKGQRRGDTPPECERDLQLHKANAPHPSGIQLRAGRCNTDSLLWVKIGADRSAFFPTSSLAVPIPEGG